MSNIERFDELYTYISSEEAYGIPFVVASSSVSSSELQGPETTDNRRRVARSIGLITSNIIDNYSSNEKDYSLTITLTGFMENDGKTFTTTNDPVIEVTSTVSASSEALTEPAVVEQIYIPEQSIDIAFESTFTNIEQAVLAQKAEKTNVALFDFDDEQISCQTPANTIANDTLPFEDLGYHSSPAAGKIETFALDSENTQVAGKFKSPLLEAVDKSRLILNQASQQLQQEVINKNDKERESEKNAREFIEYMKEFKVRTIQVFKQDITTLSSFQSGTDYDHGGRPEYIYKYKVTNVFVGEGWITNKKGPSGGYILMMDGKTYNYSPFFHRPGTEKFSGDTYEGFSGPSIPDGAVNYNGTQPLVAPYAGDGASLLANIILKLGLDKRVSRKTKPDIQS